MWKKNQKRYPGAASVLVLTHFYPPEPCAAANRISALVRALDEAGFTVEVVTGFPSFPDGIVSPADRVALRRSVLSERSRLARVFTYASTRLSGRARILNWLSVSLAMAVYVGSLRRRYAIVFVTTPPITLALPAFVARIRHRAKLVVDVRDVFPDVAINMGYWKKDGATARIVGFLASSLYRASDLVLCVTQAAHREVVERGSDPTKTVVAANGFDPIEIAPVSPYARTADQFVAAFVGNMGLATGLDVVIGAAILLKTDDRVKFVLAGGGADRDRVAARIAEEQLENVKMLGVVSRPAANALIAAADVSIVSLHARIVDSLPTKIFDALVLGTSVICSANGEARALVERSGGGIVVEPGNDAQLAEAILKLVCNPELVESYATKGKRYVEKHFDRTQIMRGVASRLRSMSHNDFP